MHSKKVMLGGNIFGCFADKEQTRAIIDCSRALGIRAIDTADIYSNGLSEEFIGDAIRSDRSEWFVATKIGLGSHASPAGLGKKKNILDRVKKSLKRLQTDYIDLYQIHHFDPETPLEETLEAFHLLKEQGIIRAAGISNYSSEQLEQLSQFPAHGIAYHQTPLNITLPIKKKPQPLSLIAYSVLARGLLNEKYLGNAIPIGSRAAISSNVRKDLSQEFLSKLELSNQLCRNYRCSLLEVALHWVWQFPDVKWSIVGVKTPHQLIHVHSAASAKIPGDTLKEFEKIWHQQGTYDHF